MNLNPFTNLSEQDMIDILNQGKLSEQELAMLIGSMQAQGLKGSFMAVDDPNSPEGLAAKEYIEYHHKIDQSYYKQMPEHEVTWAKEILFKSEVKTEDKKRALIILAHVGRPDVFKVLEDYEKNPDDELKIWINMAIQECKGFLESDLLDEPQINIGRVSPVGRNESCPCGSGRKYKKCCGA